MIKPEKQDACEVMFRMDTQTQIHTQRERERKKTVKKKYLVLNMVRHAHTYIHI